MGRDSAQTQSRRKSHRSVHAATQGHGRDDGTGRSSSGGDGSGSRVVSHGASASATAALHTLADGWCTEQPGCIASSWHSSNLSGLQRRQLLAKNWCSQRDKRLGPPASELDFCTCFPPQRLAASLPSHRCPRPDAHTRRLAPIFEGEFGFELLHALPFLNWLHSCGLLAGTRACRGMRPFYALLGMAGNAHRELQCTQRPTRSQWRHGSMPQGVPDGWSWSAKGSLRYYAYPSQRWMPPPLHHRYRQIPLILPARTSEREPSVPRAASMRTPTARGHQRTRLIYMSNKYYPEGHGTIDNFFSLASVGWPKIDRTK